MAHDWCSPATRCTRCWARATTPRCSSARPGLGAVPLTVPRRLGEILREPGLLGAAVGGLLVLALMRRRAALPIAAGFVSIAAFCVLAAAGLPILGRYLLLPAALLAVFCGAGALGWLQLPRDDPWRRRWAVIGGVVLGGLRRLHPGPGRPHLRPARLDGHPGGDPLRPARPDATTSPASRSRSRTTARSRTSRSGRASRRARSSPPSSSSRRSGLYVDPASERVLRNFTLDPRDPKRLTADVPDGFQEVAANDSWRARTQRLLRRKWTVHPPSKSASGDCPPH